MEFEAESVDSSLVLVKQGAEAVSCTRLCYLYRIGVVRFIGYLLSEGF